MEEYVRGSQEEIPSIDKFGGVQYRSKNKTYKARQRLALTIKVKTR